MSNKPENIEYRCPKCETRRGVRKDGTLREHQNWRTSARCEGSGFKPSAVALDGVRARLELDKLYQESGRYTSARESTERTIERLREELKAAEDYKRRLEAKQDALMEAAAPHALAYVNGVAADPTISPPHDHLLPLARRVLGLPEREKPAVELTRLPTGGTEPSAD